MRLRRHTILLAVFALSLTVLPAHAQTSSALVLLPWGEHNHVEAAGGGWGLFNANASHGGADVDLYRFSNFGRVRPSTEHRDWAVGWKISQLEIDTSDAALPERLADQAVAGGLKLGTFERWAWGVVAGLGYAGNTPYNDGDAWYALGSLAAQTRLDDGGTLTVLVDYDGNRNVFPDIPLPGIAYANRLNGELRYTLGLPISALTWTPGDRWMLKGTWVVPFGFGVDARYFLTEDGSLFAGYTSQATGYHIQGDDKDRRLFFEQDRVEVGARWRLSQQADVLGAVGYAFNQSFERGWDLRDTDTVRDIGDEPFIRLRLNLSF